MLKINDISFFYPLKKKATIEHFNLELAEGGVYGLLGRNGAGKSTLLYLMCGLLTPRYGEVTIDGVNPCERRPSTMRELFIVPEVTVLPPIKLRDYVKANAPFYPRFSEDDLRRHLATFELDEDLNLGQLSMGQAKKVILSFGMACNTKILLMDEPTNGLDIPGKSAFRSLIAGEMSDDRIFVISTHQVRDVSQILDRIVIMNNSKVLFDQTVAKIQERLLFGTTVSADVADRALYSIKDFGGAAIVTPNDGDDESEVNLELLFEFATKEPEKLNSIFCEK